MSDLPIPHNWDVQPPIAVQKKWLDVRIQELRSRLAAAKQLIEDLQRGRILELEAKITMLELSITELEGKRDSVIVKEEK